MDDYRGDKGSGAGRISRSAAAFVHDYAERHRHPVNAALHLVGVPAVFYGLFYVATGRSGRHRSLGLAFIVFGYVLQYLGHKKQGNEVGEVTLIKHLIGRAKDAGLRRLSSQKWLGDEELSPGRGAQETVGAGKGHGANGGHGGNGHGGNGHNGGNGSSAGRFILWWKTSH